MSPVRQPSLYIGGSKIIESTGAIMRQGLVLSAISLVTSSCVLAQERVAPLTPAQQVAIVDEVAAILPRRYVFPEVADRMTADLRARATRGEFGDTTSAESFAAQLTQHLQAISKDKHLRVRVGPPGGGRGPAATRRPDGSAFGRTARLDGNVAYVEIRSFGYPPETVRDQAREIMSAAADARALIIDLRENGGGSPHTVALISSYLFGEQPVHLNSLYFRPDDRTDDFYTDPAVAGRKFGPDKPIYVLTSHLTFSGAEEFAYNLQTRKRATIVGETTGGGAHPGGGVPLAHGMFIFVPTGRAINPITKTNWEGVGVKPDVPVDAAVALETAHRLAREAVGTSK
jgi:retinol-binding protein 3